MNTSVLDLYRQNGFTPKQKHGQEWCGPCPGCGGKDRFILRPGEGKNGEGRYWCRQCGKQGDVIQFLRDFQGLGFKEACSRLGMDSPRPITPRSPQPPSWTPKTHVIHQGAWQRKASQLVQWAAKQLAIKSSALAWLKESKGILPETAETFRLGWIPNDYFRQRKDWNIPEKIKSAGKPLRLWIPQGLCIPVLALNGEVQRVKFRPTPGKSRPKYIPLPQPEPINTSPLLYECGSPVFQIVESELDAILLAQEAQDLVNVAAMGSASYRPDQATIAKLLRADLILLSLDYDEAGNRAVWQWWNKRFGKKCKAWPTPEGKDPGEAWSLGWNLASWIKGAL